MLFARFRAVCAALAALSPAPLAICEELPGERPAWTIAGTYTADLLRNAHGGLSIGNEYLDNADLTVEVDGARALGIPGLRLFGYAIYNNGARFSEHRSGDASTVSNIDAPRALRLYEAWAEWRAAGDAASLRVGLYDLNSEFDASEARALFVNSTFGVGHELAQTGSNGPSIFPVTSLGARLAAESAQGWTLLMAVLDGVPGNPDDPAQTHIRLSSEDGALAIAELQYAAGLWHKLAAGLWRYTSQFAHIEDVMLGRPAPRRSANAGGYALADVAVLRQEHESARGVDLFLRAGFASAQVSEFDVSAQAGIVVRQPFAAHVEESMGLALAWLRTGGPFRRAQRLLGEPIEDSERVIELTYRRALTPWLTLQPDVQFVLDPAGARSVRDALVLGLRIEIGGSKSW